MFLLIDKPEGMSSHDVVNRVRDMTGERKVGHAGTLDPLATGLLIIGVGRSATRHLGVLSKGTHKTYEAQIVLGEQRDTDDAEGVVFAKAKGVLPPTRGEVERILVQFLGKQAQTPPKFSAVKQRGKKAYVEARKGKPLTLAPRTVTVLRLSLLGYRYPVVEIRAVVSAGTYIRALARDLGRRLGMGGYLSRLRRTGIGTFSIRQAVTLDRLTHKNWKAHGIAVSDAL